uniref:Uncharacterized protein n=1 Tax=Arundo donax TaxID=35708 RepID=A0A0A9G5J7_ARUDO
MHLETIVLQPLPMHLRTMKILSPQLSEWKILKKHFKGLLKVFLVDMQMEPQVMGEASPLIWMMNFVLIDTKNVGHMVGSFCATL